MTRSFNTRVFALTVLMLILAICGIILYFYPDRNSEWVSLWIMSLTSTAIAAILALLLIELKRQKADFAITFYRNFESVEGIKARCFTDEICRQYKDKNLSFMELYDELFLSSADQRDREKWIMFSFVIHFYSQLGKFIKESMLDDKICSDLFGEYFVHFLKQSFIKNMMARSKNMMEQNNEEAFWFKNIDFLKKKWNP